MPELVAGGAAQLEFFDGGAAGVAERRDRRGVAGHRPLRPVGELGGQQYQAELVIVDLPPGVDQLNRTGESWLWSGPPVRASGQRPARASDTAELESGQLHHRAVLGV